MGRLLCRAYRCVKVLTHAFGLLLVTMDGRHRKDIRPGITVRIVLKKDQRSGKLTEGVVKDILTGSPTHPHGIKVRLRDGQVGRVKEILKSSGL
ncbi:MAG: YwbE family protein [Candidatus Undinarchaeales archaeon]|nr:YwbE family protein [Candidatus Undinarchaeales archaeon]MDP7492246.1 YwbE family protein [Candidatus Undinarchaeales archaeon]